jgi:hypothetical protein
MPRLHLIGLEDQSWFPTRIRDLATDYLEFVERRFAIHRAMVPVLADALRETGQRQVIDLCSGGAGPVSALAATLFELGLEARFTLTDRFPNLPAFESVSATSEGRITYVAEPVDARRVPVALSGFRTIFNAFHHFQPDDAVAVLADAVAAGQPIGVFEVPERAPLHVVGTTVLTPFMVALLTPRIRPFRWERLFWTYLLPAVPFTCWWDGTVSQLRAYSVSELQDLTKRAELQSYRWKTGRTPIESIPAHVTYLIGAPV